MKQSPNKNIPEIVYQELVDLFGQEKADEIDERKGIDFRYLSLGIFAEKFKRRFGVNVWLVCTIILILFLLSAII